MRNPWNLLRCSLDRHRWIPVTESGTKSRECRDCHRRDFDVPNYAVDPYDAVRNATAGGWTGGPP